MIRVFGIDTSSCKCYAVWHLQLCCWLLAAQSAMLRPVGSEFNCSSLTCLTMCGTSTGSALPSPSLHFSLLSLSVSLFFSSNLISNLILLSVALAMATNRQQLWHFEAHFAPGSPHSAICLPYLPSPLPSAVLPYTCFTVGHFIFSFQRATAFKSIKNLFKSPSPSPNGVSPVCGLFSSINLSCPSALAMCALPCAAFRHTCFIN